MMLCDVWIFFFFSLYGLTISFSPCVSSVCPFDPCAKRGEGCGEHREHRDEAGGSLLFAGGRNALVFSRMLKHNNYRTGVITNREQ